MHVLSHVDHDRLDALRRGDDFFWLDLAFPSYEDLGRLAGALGIHPLAIEDTREFGQRPKLDVYDDYVLLVFYTAQELPGDPEPQVSTIEIHVYVSGGWIVTVRREPCGPLDTLHDVLIPQDAEEEEYVVYRILDALTKGYFPVLAHIEQRIDELEAEVLVRPQRAQLTTVYRLRQDVHDLFRRAHPQNEQISATTDAILALPGLAHGMRPYLRDVGDGLSQVVGQLHTANADLAFLTDTFFNASTHRLSRTATRLAVVATFFLVWTLVTSFFGQNFGWLVDNVDSKTDFLLFGVAGLVLPTAVLAVFFYRSREDWL